MSDRSSPSSSRSRSRSPPSSRSASKESGSASSSSSSKRDRSSPSRSSSLSSSSSGSERRSAAKAPEAKPAAEAPPKAQQEALEPVAAINPPASEAEHATAKPAADPTAGSAHAATLMEEGLFRRSRVNNRFQQSLKKRDNEMVLSWKNLTYKVDATRPAQRVPGQHFKNFVARSTKYEKTVLNDVSGYVRPGQFLAIMGPSGSGKTTLLNLLAKRVKDGRITGDILLNGQPIPDKLFKTVSSYVQQDDLLFANLTVKETLDFTSSLKSPKGSTQEDRDHVVSDVIEELGLKKVRETIIGNEQVRGVSGGERKRTNVANELMGNPYLIFLDEPTSGLDAFTALSIVETLDSLARNNYSIVCTVHQPRYNIFELFDMLMLLSAGEVVYFGPAKQAVVYFSSLNYPCPKYYNPSDYFMDLLTKDTRTPEGEENSNKTIKLLTDAYRHSAMIKTAENPVIETKELHSSIVPPSFWQQFKVLCVRSARNVYRDRSLTFARVGQNIVTALVVGLTYLRLGHGQTDVQSRRGLLFLVLMNQMFGALFLVFNVFPVERVIYWKEHNAGLYSTLPYYLAKSIVELPLTLFFPLLFSAVVYFMANLRERFVSWLLFVVYTELATLTAEGLGLLITIAIPKKEMASVVSLLVIVLFVIFGGFYLNNKNTPHYFIWIQWLSFVRWSFEALVVNEFSGAKFDCPQDWLVPYNTTPAQCTYPTGEFVISSLDFHKSWMGWDALVLIGMIFFYRILAYIALRFVRPKQEAY